MHAPQSPYNASNKPQLCFGTVRHKRLRPAINGFAYGVYFIRLPLRSMASSAGAESPGFSRWFSRNRFNLLSFHDADHGDGRQPLTQWIDGLLRAEGIGDADGEIWLQTFPRVLGYVFNPVSFWFCHRSDGALRAVLCDVRNTFGERHAYLLDQGGPLRYGEELTARKVFHVSPFCRIEGGYRFRFMRASRQVGDAAQEHVVARIDHDDAQGPLLQTSVSGIAQAASDRLALKAFFSYPLMTLGVIARIHWQALRLWRKRVPFISKPLPPASDLSR
ncbi:MAG: hypothetical protein JWR22_3013 [Herminiimonas sp.]|nr:hypothetical protein [Herminiimonas sp.]